MRPRSLLAMCLVAGLGVAGGAVADSVKCKLVRMVDWPARIVRNHIVVEGAINGQKIGITLDTGSEISVILRSTAVRLDLPRRATTGTRIFGLGGESKTEIASVDDFKPIDAILDSGASSSVLAKQDAASLGVTPDSPGVVAGYSSQGLGAKSVDSWIGSFQSFAIGNEHIPDVRIRFADLYRQATYTATGSHVAKKVSRTEPMLLGADFLRAHRTLVAHSQRRLYFTYFGGPVFQVEAGGSAARPAPGRRPRFHDHQMDRCPLSCADRAASDRPKDHCSCWQFAAEASSQPPAHMILPLTSMMTWPEG